MAIRRPLMVPFLSSLNKSLEKTSELKIKKKQDRGSLCLNPLSSGEVTKGAAIQQDGKGGRGNADSDPRDPDRAEP
jgi:hypothetical protein